MSIFPRTFLQLTTLRVGMWLALFALTLLLMLSGCGLTPVSETDYHTTRRAPIKKQHKPTLTPVPTRAAYECPRTTADAFMDCLEDKARVYADFAAIHGGEYHSLWIDYETLYEFVSSGPLTCTVSQ